MCHHVLAYTTSTCAGAQTHDGRKIVCPGSALALSATLPHMHCSGDVRHLTRGGTSAAARVEGINRCCGSAHGHVLRKRRGGGGVRTKAIQEALGRQAGRQAGRQQGKQGRGGAGRRQGTGQAEDLRPWTTASNLVGVEASILGGQHVALALPQHAAQRGVAGVVAETAVAGANMLGSSSCGLACAWETSQQSGVACEGMAL